MKRRKLMRLVASPPGETEMHLLQVHPISDRSEEIISITLHLLARFAAVHGKTTPELSQDAADFLVSRHWTLSDLAGRVSQAVALNEGSLITAADLV